MSDLDILGDTFGDGFTSSERVRDLTLPPDEWTPQHDYEDASIGELAPGPRRVCFTARVVNLYDQGVNSKMPKAARGCLKVLVKDDSAVILINLWYATASYNLRLGTLVTLWTTHLHSTSSVCAAVETLNMRPATLLTSIFPERDRGCHIQIYTDDDSPDNSVNCRTPLGYISGQSLMGMMSLNNFINGGGDEIPDAKILVYVAAIGQVTTFTSKFDSKQVTTLSVGLSDSSNALATLPVFSQLIPSAQSWKPYHTVLLISFATRRANRRNEIRTTSRTQIDVDPAMVEADALRNWAQRENCPINQEFPAEVFDVEAVETSPLRLQFTFASLAAFVEAAPAQVYTGYLSGILAGLNIVGLYEKRRLFCMECCGTPVYGNQVSGWCGYCGREMCLRVNPNVVSEIADETGAIGTYGPNGVGGAISTAGSPSGEMGRRRRNYSTILWTDEAWTHLLGRTPADLAALCDEDGYGGSRTAITPHLESLRYLEQRLLWMRVILMVGWTGSYGGGRLAILKVVA